MIVLSLFDGISCARVALQRAGIPVEKYYASEVDKYAIQVTKKNRSETLHIGNVKDVQQDGRFLDEGNEQCCMNDSIDLLIGGSPCQDLSIAKKNRQGLDGEKSGLFREYVRILKETKPKRFILENVASMPKEAKAIITAELGVDPIMIDASLVCAQSRKRLFRTNIPGVTLPEDKGIILKDIVEDEVDEKFFLSEETTERILTTRGNGKQIGQAGRIRSLEGKSVTLQAGGGGTGAKTGLYKVGNTHPSGKGMNGNVYSDQGKHPTLTTNKGEGQKILSDCKIRRLTPVECERLQCLPDEYTAGISNSQRYKCLGNAFNVDVIAHILSFIPKK